MHFSSIERALICAALASVPGCSGGGLGEGPSDASSDTSVPDPQGDAGGPGLDGGQAPDASGAGDSSSHSDAAIPDSGTGGIACTGASPSFATTVHPIFQASCGGEMCHNGTAGPTFPYSSLVNVHASKDACAVGSLLVAPGSLANSYLISKLTGIGMCSGVQMPKGLSLHAGDVQTIADWVCSGAKNN